MLHTYWRNPLAQRLTLLLCYIILPATSAYSQSALTPDASQPFREAKVIERIDAAVKHRSDHIAGYSVREIYSIFRNGESNPSVQVTVNTVFKRGAGKDYTPVSATGSSVLRNIVVDKVLANEKEMARAENRDKVSITSANYEMHLLPGKVTLNGRDCIVVSLKARRKTSTLLNGKGWFDAGDLTLVHLEGSPAQSVSVFAGDTSGRRDYERIEGFSMAQHAELHSHSFLFGDTLLKIDYSDYKIDLDPKAP
jgi:hypothetical protein